MKFGRKDYDKRIIDKEGLIPEDEPVFFLRGKDKLAPRLLLKWASEFLLDGGDPLVAESAIRHANKMIEYQRLHGASIANKISEGHETPYTNEVLSKINELIDELDNICDKSKSVSSKQDLLEFNYYNNLNELLRLIPDSDNNVLILSGQLLSSNSYDKLLKDLSIFDFDLDKSVFNRAKDVRYLIYLDPLMNIIHFIRK